MNPTITGESKAKKASKYKEPINFVGSGWINELKSGEKVLNIKINQDANGNSFVLNGINDKCQLSLYKNKNKREGKQDPDYNMSVYLPADETEEESAPEPAQAPVTEPVAALEPPF